MRPEPPDPARSLPPGFEDSGTPLPERKERLYRAVARVQAFLHGEEAQDALPDALRLRYPAPRYLLESGRRALERTGFSRQDAFYYALIPALTRTSLSQRWGARPLLGDACAMSEYLRMLYVGLHGECFYLVLLDRQCRLIRPVMIQRGGHDDAPFYLGRLLDAALNGGARHVVLAHNHPRGTPFPSREDVHCTLRALNAFAPLEIPLLDHMIVVGDRVISIRGMGLIPEVLWRGISPADKAVNGWLDGYET